MLQHFINYYIFFFFFFLVLLLLLLLLLLLSSSLLSYNYHHNCVNNKLLESDLSSYKQALFVGLILLNWACNFKSYDSPDNPSLNCSTRIKWFWYLAPQEIKRFGSRTSEDSTECCDAETEPVLQDFFRRIACGRSDKAQDARLDIHASGFLEQKRSVLFDVRVCHKNAESFRDLKPQQFYQIICIEHLHH